MDEQVVILECEACRGCTSWALELIPENATLGEMAQAFFDEHMHSEYGFTVRVPCA